MRYVIVNINYGYYLMIDILGRRNTTRSLWEASKWDTKQAAEDYAECYSSHCLNSKVCAVHISIAE